MRTLYRWWRLRAAKRAAVGRLDCYRLLLKS
jgi:hypothetical protein